MSCSDIEAELEKLGKLIDKVGDIRALEADVTTRAIVVWLRERAAALFDIHDPPCSTIASAVVETVADAIESGNWRK